MRRLAPLVILAILTATQVAQSAQGRSEFDAKITSLLDKVEGDAPQSNERYEDMLEVVKFARSSGSSHQIQSIDECNIVRLADLVRGRELRLDAAIVLTVIGPRAKQAIPALESALSEETAIRHQSGPVENDSVVQLCRALHAIKGKWPSDCVNL